MKICTGAGDQGYSFLAKGASLPKSHLAFDVMGDLDELSCAIGIAKVAEGAEKFIGFLEEIQGTLITVMAYIASCGEEKHLLSREQADLPYAHLSCDFSLVTLAGENELSARLSLARAVARRAERSYVRYCESFKGDKNAMIFLNRISDALYIASLCAKNSDK